MKTIKKIKIHYIQKTYVVLLMCFFKRTGLKIRNKLSIILIIKDDEGVDLLL